MGYYADLIKEKQNAKVFPVPGTTKELKTRAEVERYMFEQRREVDKCISWMEMAKKRIQDAEKEPKPRGIDWATRYGRAKDSYKTYKRWMEMHEDFAARAEDWLSKNRNSKDNEKEERDNYKMFGKEGEEHEKRWIPYYAKQFSGSLKIGTMSKRQIVHTMMIDYDWSEKNAVKVADEAERIAKRNSKEEGYYAKLAEEKKNYDRKESAYKIALSLWRKKIPFNEMKRQMQEEHHFSYDETIMALDKVAGDEKNRERNEIAREYNK